MDESTTTTGFGSDTHGLYSRAPFLTTHRALAACTRELTRLTDALLDRSQTLSATLGTPKPVVRRPPGRCIIQLGDVALTAVWLRSSPESAATGELMVNIWQGAVSPRLHHRTERPGERGTPEPAMLLWERVLTPTAETEATWGWHHESADESTMTSEDLASLCVEQLGLAYVNALSSTESPE